MSAIAPQQRVDVDEAGVDDTRCSPYGWSARTTRCTGQRLGHRTTRVAMAAAWWTGTVLAPLRFHGDGDAHLIEAWVAQQLVKARQRGQTVIVGHASFHRMEPLRTLLAPVQCSLLPLPPYSPDLNAIEPVWNQIKHKIMLDARPHPSFRHTVDAAFLELATYEALYHPSLSVMEWSPKHRTTPPCMAAWSVSRTCSAI